MANTLTKGEYRGCKSRLTRAQRAGDPKRIKAAAEYALQLFERKGYPDDWHRWQRALEDAQYDQRFRYGHDERDI